VTECQKKLFLCSHFYLIKLLVWRREEHSACKTCCNNPRVSPRCGSGL